MLVYKSTSVSEAEEIRMSNWKIGVITASDSIAKGEREDDRIGVLRQLSQEFLQADVSVYQSRTIWKS